MLLYLVLMMMMMISMIFMMMMLSNLSVLVVSVKVFNFGFYSDLEVLFSMWNFLFMFMVLMISMSVMFFVLSYMSVNWVSNFILLYLLFVISMFWLIMNCNFYWMMFGWDGLGVSSFLLIVYYMNYESSTNGLFTLFQNRVGDLFFVLFLVGVMEMTLGGVILMNYWMFLLVVGALVKCAQFPFNAWLLTAMSAPTPISSLVHSSTLVVAGVYILLQYSYCLGVSLEILKYLSLITLIISLLGLMFESDMKKLIAYSTMSHVGLMIYLMSYKLFKITYFHLNVHAMFKSMMFMCFGFVMLVSYHGQDYRLVTMVNLNPIVKMCYFYSCLCLMGLPFLSAFFSKDFIIEKCLECNGEVLEMIFLMMFLSVSVYYGMKLLKLSSYMNVMMIMEKFYLGLFSLIIMMVWSSIMINIYISVVFSLSLESFSLKFFIYIWMIMFLIFFMFLQMNYKFVSYSKIINIQDTWIMNFYLLDSYVYSVMEKLSLVFNQFFMMKLVLMMNWWLMMIFIMVW